MWQTEGVVFTSVQHSTLNIAIFADIGYGAAVSGISMFCRNLEFLAGVIAGIQLNRDFIEHGCRDLITGVYVGAAVDGKQSQRHQRTDRAHLPLILIMFTIST